METRCANARFEQTGIVRMEPRKYCSDRCRQDAWVLRRVAALLASLSDGRGADDRQERKAVRCKRSCGRKAQKDGNGLCKPCAERTATRDRENGRVDRRMLSNKYRNGKRVR